ncbi:MAG: TlpA family protein disulfide reductase [Burkholderiaceae bacterium]
MNDQHMPDGGQELTESTGISRRRWLYGSVAGVATLSGLGLYWWKGASAPTTASESKIWELSFRGTANTEVRMRELLGRPLLLNFWATWCPPCIEELPLLDSFYTKNSSKRWQVLGIAVDNLGAVEAFLNHSPVRFPVVLAGMEGIELSRNLGNLTGGLPFTVAFAADGRVLQRKIGRLKAEDLALWSGLA